MVKVYLRSMPNMTSPNTLNHSEGLLLVDPIYGESIVYEPVLIELMESAPVERLKHINQYGPPQQWYDQRFGYFTRYDHSVGTMLLLKKLGASTEEQTAGLLHDVAHTAFSHVGDWVFGDQRNESYHDNFHNGFVSRSGILEILDRHSIDQTAALDIKSFTLLEQPMPAVCADRLDFALREANIWVDPTIANRVLAVTVVAQGQIVFTDQTVAREFAEAYLRLQQEHWGGPEANLRFKLLSNALKIAIRARLLDPSDLYQTDDELVGKLEAMNDMRIDAIIGALKGKLEFELNDQHYDWVLRKKFRHVDPLVTSAFGISTLTEIDQEFARTLQAARMRNYKGLMVRLLNLPPELLVELN